MKRIFLTLSLLVTFSYVSNAQVLISLLLGDKLNSEKLEFGLIGGLSLANTGDFPDEDTKVLPALHLGFYFDFLMDDKWSFTPGVLVISRMGARGIDPYETGNADLDAAMIGGKVERRIEYFQVPLLMKYRFTPKIYATAGPQVALLNKAKDIFSNQLIDSKDDDVFFKRNIKDDFKKLDAGFAAGLGYKFREKGKTMTAGVKYYQGFIDVIKDNPGDAIYNKAWYLYVTIPIGAGKAEKKEKEG